MHVPKKWIGNQILRLKKCKFDPKKRAGSFYLLLFLLLCSVRVQQLRSGRRLVLVGAEVLPDGQRRLVSMERWWAGAQRRWAPNRITDRWDVVSVLMLFVLTGEDMTLEGRRQLALFLVRNESVHLLSLSHLLPLQEGFYSSFTISFFFFFTSNKLPPLFFLNYYLIFFGLLAFLPSTLLQRKHTRLLRHHYRWGTLFRLP